MADTHGWGYTTAAVALAVATAACSNGDDRNPASIASLGSPRPIDPDRDSEYCDRLVDALEGTFTVEDKEVTIRANGDAFRAAADVAEDPNRKIAINHIADLVDARAAGQDPPDDDIERLTMDMGAVVVFIDDMKQCGFDDQADDLYQPLLLHGVRDGGVTAVGSLDGIAEIAPAYVEGKWISPASSDQVTINAGYGGYGSPHTADISRAAADVDPSVTAVSR